MSLGEIQQVSEGIYAYLQPDGSWWLNNTGFLASRDGVISVDATSTERRTRAYLDAIATVTDRPVRTLVNTHHHGDHTHGNYLFGGATIVGHERCREAMLGTPMPPPAGVWTDVDWGPLELAPPFLTYTDGVTLWSGDLRCEVRYVGTPAHTTNDSILHIPERSVVFAGDLLFNGGTPFALMGSVGGWIEVLETVLRPLGARSAAPRSSTTCWPTCASCSAPPARPRRKACPRCRPHGPWTWVSSKIFLMPNGSWGTFTGPTSSWTVASAAPPSTSSRLWATWWPTTAAVPSPVTLRVVPWLGLTRKSRGCSGSTPS
jgi:glyoxylase-like metal-dependent hydrolase (beta-lactamase superfamily II)